MDLLQSLEAVKSDAASLWFGELFYYLQFKSFDSDYYCDHTIMLPSLKFSPLPATPVPLNLLTISSEIGYIKSIT